MAGTRGRGRADRVGAELARDRRVDVEVPHKLSYPGFCATAIT
jgi:hypothetical protein